jgi:hypothetical protein
MTPSALIAISSVHVSYSPMRFIRSKCEIERPDSGSKTPAVGLDSMLRPLDLDWLTSVAGVLLMSILMLKNTNYSSAPAMGMAVARVAYEDGFLLDARPHQHHSGQPIMLVFGKEIWFFFRSTMHLPVATLCSRRTWIDRVAVIDAFADGETLGDLDAHRRFGIGTLLLSGLDSGYWLDLSPNMVLLTIVRVRLTARTL